MVWHSKFLEEDDWVGAEFFDWARFDHFMKRATVLMNTFAQFKLLVVKAVDEQRGVQDADIDLPSGSDTDPIRGL